jgi:hypothetical protein
MSAAAPERLEKVPVLEEHPSATGTNKARHAASSPGNCDHPGEDDKENRRVLEEQAVKKVDKQKHSGDAAKEQEPKNRGSAIQITPGRLERKTRAHIMFPLPVDDPGVCLTRLSLSPLHLNSALYGGIQCIQGWPMLEAGAPIGSLDAASCTFPIPRLHIRVKANRILQAVVSLDRSVPIVHQAV